MKAGGYSFHQPLGFRGPRRVFFFIHAAGGSTARYQMLSHGVSTGALFLPGHGYPALMNVAALSARFRLTAACTPANLAVCF